LDATVETHPDQKGPTSNICGLGIVEESPGTRQGVKPTRNGVSPANKWGI